MIKDFYWKFYLIALIAIGAMIMHIELIINNRYAPETVLIRVSTDEGLPEGNAECFADILSEQANEQKKPLQALPSIYEYINPETFFASMDEGFYLLETGFADYQGDFEIRIVCYSKGLKGVSYTIINNTNQNCEIKHNGRFLVC